MKRVRIISSVIDLVILAPCMGNMAIAAPAGNSAGEARSSSVSTSTFTQRKRVRKRRRRKPVVKKPSLVNKILEGGVAGLVVGFNSNSLECDCAENIDYSSEKGFYGGATYDKAINKLIGYRGELMYAMRNTRAQLAPNSNDRADVTLNYMHTSAQLALRFNASRLASIYLSIGPYAAFLVSSEAKVNGNKVKDVADNFGFLDYGLTVGAGGFFAISKSMGLLASVGLQYTNGFADVVDKSSNPDDTISTRALMLTAGIHFSGG